MVVVINFCADSQQGIAATTMACSFILTTVRHCMPLCATLAIQYANNKKDGSPHRFTFLFDIIHKKELLIFMILIGKACRFAATKYYSQSTGYEDIIVTAHNSSISNKPSALN